MSARFFTPAQAVADCTRDRRGYHGSDHALGAGPVQWFFKLPSDQRDGRETRDRLPVEIPLEDRPAAPLHQGRLLLAPHPPWQQQPTVRSSLRGRPDVRRSGHIVAPAKGGTKTLSCALITMPANELLAAFDNEKLRMFAVLREEDHEAWLTGSAGEALQALRPYQSEGMEAWQVSRRIYANKSRTMRA